MPDKPKLIRNAAKALIIRDRHLLTICKRDVNGLWYILPGGGQNHGETLEQTLVRECLEEIGTAIAVDRLLFVREFIGHNHLDGGISQDNWVKTAHTIDFIFRCHIDSQYIPQNGHLPDDGQEQVVWLPINNIQEYRLFPSPLKILIQDEAKLLENNLNVYLGDVH